MIQLRDYQKEAIDIIMQCKNRGLIVLPTGSGKTIIFSKISSLIKNRVLIVVPSTELREQTIDKLKMIDSSLDIGSVQAQLDEVDSKIIVSTRQSLTHKKSNRIERMLQNGDFELVIFDEIHQAVGQVKKIINKINKNAKILGFTATPFNIELFDIFPEIIYQKTLLDMIMKDYLIEPKALMITTNTNISNVKTVAGEFNQKQLEQVVNNEERNKLIVEAYKKYASDRKSTIVFATGIDHSRALSEIFNEYGIYCKSIDSTLEKEDREKILQEFKSGKLPVLCNCNILSTGFDHPPIDCIMFCRPTKSKTLYVQILGRGLRVSPETNKENCLVIDFNDITKKHDLMSISDVFNVNIKSGKTLKEAIKEFQQEQKEQEILEEQRRKEIELHAKEIKLLNKQLKERFSEAYYDWFRVDNFTYALSINSDNHYVITQKDDNLFEVYRICTEKYKNSVEFIESGSNLFEIIEEVENNLMKYPTSFSYRNAEWKLHPATKKQKKYIWNAKTKWDCHKYFKKYLINKILNQ